MPAQSEKRGAPGTVWSWINAALAFLYPETCQLCREERARPDQGFVCEPCRSKVRWIEPPFCDRCGMPFAGDISTRFECANCRDQDFSFVRARSAVVARDGVLEAIHRYKYHRSLYFEPFLTELFLAKAVPELSGSDWDLIVPVPLYSTRQREREFNQAERLARQLAQALGLPLDTRVLRRVVPTPTQTRLSREERWANVRKAFSAHPASLKKGAKVIVVDDVLTTGATTNACAAKLLEAGAAQVCVWTLARGA